MIMENRKGAKKKLVSLLLQNQKQRQAKTPRFETKILILASIPNKYLP